MDFPYNLLFCRVSRILDFRDFLVVPQTDFSKNGDVDSPHCRKLNISWIGGRQNLSIAARSLQTRIVEHVMP